MTRLLPLCLLALLASPLAAQELDCRPPMTSWGFPLVGCANGQVCVDLEGWRIQALAGDEATGIAIRDVDKKYCRYGRPAPANLVYAYQPNGRDFRFADCVLSYWWVQEFAGLPEGCYPRVTVLTVSHGAVTVRP